MSRMAPGRVQILAQRERALMQRWLETLPPAGWKGTAPETADAIAARGTMLVLTGAEQVLA